MATRVFNEETFELLDGTEVIIRPLNIKRLRKFMAVVNEMQNANTDDEDEILNYLVRGSAIAIGQKSPQLENDLENLEEILDMETIHRIFELAGGVKLNDPNVQKALAEQLGKN